jgi:Domain of unknown function (DUF4340)
LTLKSTITYWALFALLGGYYLAVERMPPPPTTAAVEREKVLNVFADEVTSITLVRDGKEIRCERRDNRWQIVEPEGAKVPPDLVEALVENLTERKEAEEIVAQPKPEELRAFGLADGAQRADFELAGGKKASVTIGARNPSQTAVYVQTNSSPRVLLAGLTVQYYADLLYAAGSKAAVASSSSDPDVEKN